MTEDVGVGGKGERSTRRTRIVMIVFGVAALVAILGSVALPLFALDRVEANCAAAGGTYIPQESRCDGVEENGELDRPSDD